MNIFCRHEYKVKNVVRGENLFGDSMYAIAFWCIKCNHRKLDKGWGKESAEKHVDWLRAQGK